MSILKTFVTVLCFFVFSSLFSQNAGSPEFKKKFPQAMGNLKTSKNYVVFREIYNHQSLTDSIIVYNNWTEDMTFQAKQIPSYVKVRIEPKILPPQQEGIIYVTYDAKIRNTFGYDFYRLGIHTNDNKQPIKLFNVSANIVEDFSNLTEEEKTNAPVIQFDNETFDFDHAAEGTKVRHSFVFTNKGKRDLKIRRTKASCGCTASTPAKTTLKPGESSTIDIIFNTSHRKGPQHKTITVISNDPKNFQKILHVKGNVTPISEYYPFVQGGIRMQKQFFYVGTITNKQIKSDSILMYNNWSGNMTFDYIDTVSCISADQFIIYPRNRKYLKIDVDGSKIGEIGRFEKTFTMKTNDGTQQVKTFKVRGTLLNDYSNLSETEMANAPVVQLDIPDELNLGEQPVKKGQKFTFEIHNVGHKGKLEIIKLLTNNKNLSLSVNKAIVKKKKYATVTVLVDPKNSDKEIDSKIYIYTNAPEYQEIVVDVRGVIE